MTKTSQTNNELTEAIKSNTFSNAITAYNNANNNLLMFNAEHDPNLLRMVEMTLRGKDKDSVNKFRTAMQIAVIASVCHIAYLYENDQIPEFGKDTAERIIRQTMEVEEFYKLAMKEYKNVPDLSLITVWDKLRSKKK